MPTISIRDLADRASWVIRRVQETKRPFIVTNRGEPVAAVVPLDAGKMAEAMEDWVLAHHPSFAADMAEAEQAMAEGRTVALDEALDDEHAAIVAQRATDAAMIKAEGGTPF